MAALMRATTAAGVPAGANTPCQDEIERSTLPSLHGRYVGVFGNAVLGGDAENAHLLRLAHGLERREDIEIGIDVAAGKRDCALTAAAEGHVSHLGPSLFGKGRGEDLGRTAGVDADPHLARVFLGVFHVVR